MVNDIRLSCPTQHFISLQHVKGEPLREFFFEILARTGSMFKLAEGLFHRDSTESIGRKGKPAYIVKSLKRIFRKLLSPLDGSMKQPRI
jgi:hypothetical protein